MATFKSEFDIKADFIRVWEYFGNPEKLANTFFFFERVERINHEESQWFVKPSLVNFLKSDHMIAVVKYLLEEKKVVFSVKGGILNIEGFIRFTEKAPELTGVSTDIMINISGILAAALNPLIDREMRENEENFIQNIRKNIEQPEPTQV
jgi:carbon monoxide dehydrogenase subunit G